MILDLRVLEWGSRNKPLRVGATILVSIWGIKPESCMNALGGGMCQRVAGSAAGHRSKPAYISMCMVISSGCPCSLESKPVEFLSLSHNFALLPSLKTGPAYVYGITCGNACACLLLNSTGSCELNLQWSCLQFKFIFFNFFWVWFLINHILLHV